MKVAEVGSDDVPVRLLALQMKFDQVDQDPLQVGAELGGRLEVLDFVSSTFDVCVPMTSPTLTKLESLQISV